MAPGQVILPKTVTVTGLKSAVGQVAVTRARILRTSVTLDLATGLVAVPGVTGLGGIGIENRMSVPFFCHRTWAGFEKVVCLPFKYEFTN